MKCNVLSFSIPSFFGMKSAAEFECICHSSERTQEKEEWSTGVRNSREGVAPNGPDCPRNFQKSPLFFKLMQVFLDFILHWFNTKGFSANTFSLVILHKEPVFVVLKLRNSEQACLLTSARQTSRRTCCPNGPLGNQGCDGAHRCKWQSWWSHPDLPIAFLSILWIPELLFLPRPSLANSSEAPVLRNFLASWRGRFAAAALKRPRRELVS